MRKKPFTLLACFGRWCFGGPPSINCGVTLHRFHLVDQAFMVDRRTVSWAFATTVASTAVPQLSEAAFPQFSSFPAITSLYGNISNIFLQRTAQHKYLR